MGMPGSETALEELMSRVLGDLIQEGIVTKLADDLFCGGETAHQLLVNLRCTFQALHHCNLRLSANKSVICPKTTTILGWIWSQGTLKASPHRISTLATCSPPETVKRLRAFIGAYRALSRVMSNCSGVLSAFEERVAGRESKEKVTWTESLQTEFLQAQKALDTKKTITLPCPSDQLWIVTDASVKQHGIGST